MGRRLGTQSEVTMAQGMMSVGILLLSVLASAQVAERRPALIRPVDGATVYQHYCAPCHGMDGRGKGPVSGALREEVPDLTTLARRNGGKFPADKVKETIAGDGKLIPAHGSKDMPIWGPTFHEIEFDQDLGNVRLENVSQYLESLQRK
jgi:mono/diheme cytochrome c family protein